MIASPTGIRWKGALATQIDESLRLVIGNKTGEGIFADCVECHIVSDGVRCRGIGTVTAHRSDISTAVDELGNVIPNRSRLPFIEFPLSEAEDRRIQRAIVDQSPSVIFAIVQVKLADVAGFVIREGTIRSPEGYCDIPVA